MITGNYSAGYGIVNAMSKSGTNALHGDAYEFFRSQKVEPFPAVCPTQK